MNESENYKKEFNSWNTNKQFLDNKVTSDTLYFYKREVWWCSIGVNIGVEIDGKNSNFERPVLIIRKFNGMMFWGVPLSSKTKAHSYVLEVKHNKGISFANLAQLRLFSSKRVLRKIGMIDKSCFKFILNQLKNCL